MRWFLDRRNPKARRIREIVVSPFNHTAGFVRDGEGMRTPEIVEKSARLGQLMVDSVSESTGAKN